MNRIGLPKEEARRIAEKIAAGHAYEDHVIGDKQFGRQLTIAEFALVIENALINPTQSKFLRRRRHGFWFRPDGLLVVVDPLSPDGGTAYVTEHALERFRKLV
jgi:hypothetical protein